MPKPAVESRTYSYQHAVRESFSLGLCSKTAAQLIKTQAVVFHEPMSAFFVQHGASIPAQKAHSRELTTQVLDGPIDYAVAREDGQRDTEPRKRSLVTTSQHRMPSPCVLPSKHHSLSVSLARYVPSTTPMSLKAHLESAERGTLRARTLAPVCTTQKTLTPTK